MTRLLTSSKYLISLIVILLAIVASILGYIEVDYAFDFIKFIVVTAVSSTAIEDGLKGYLNQILTDNQLEQISEMIFDIINKKEVN